jgi:hypothetical protein
MSFRWSGNPLSALVECGLVGVFLMLGFYGACLTGPIILEVLTCPCRCILDSIFPCHVLRVAKRVYWAGPHTNSTHTYVSRVKCKALRAL